MVVRHPLQPFAPAAFGGDSEPRRFSYHAQWWPAAAQPAQTRVALPAWFGDAALAPVDDETGATLSLDELRRFLQAPAEVFLRQRLGLRLADGEGVDADVEPPPAPGRGFAAPTRQKAGVA